FSPSLLLTTRLPPRSTLFPYTTLFRSFQFTFGDQRGYRIHNQYINGSRPDEVIGNFQRLLSIVRLRNEQVIYIHTQLLGVIFVKSMFRIDEGGHAAFLLRFGDHMNGQGGFARRFRTIDLHYPSFGESSDTQCDIQANGTGGYCFHLNDG